jgi:hypothetical protein
MGIENIEYKTERVRANLKAQIIAHIKATKLFPKVFLNTCKFRSSLNNEISILPLTDREVVTESLMMEICEELKNELFAFLNGNKVVLLRIVYIRPIISRDTFTCDIQFGSAVKLDDIYEQ